MRVLIGDRQICFGSEPYNVVVEEILSRKSTVSLIIPRSQDEPLFNLVSSEGDPKFGPDLKARLAGFGQAALMESNVQPRHMTKVIYEVMATALPALKKYCVCFPRPQIHGEFCALSPRRSPDRSRILETAQMFFGLDEIDESALRNAEDSLSALKRPKTHHILALFILSLSRIHRQDLKHCAEVPFSLKVFQKDLNYEKDYPDLRLPSISESFDILAKYLLGHRYSQCVVEQALLVSNCGWSIFFDAIDATDPCDVSLRDLRVVEGVPSIQDASKNSVVKDMVLDGSTELGFDPTNSTILKAAYHSNDSNVNFFPGVSTAKRGDSLIGFRDNDAFTATQSFTWQVRGTQAKTHILGFREMVEICESFYWLPTCSCDDKKAIPEYLRPDEILVMKSPESDRFLPTIMDCRDLLNSEAAICSFRMVTKTDSIRNKFPWYFFVTNNPAARWLQMDDMVKNTEFFSENGIPRVYIRGSETCIACALDVEKSIPQYWRASLILL